MVNITLLQLFVLTVMLLSAAQVYLVVRFLVWPRIQRLAHCPWCWAEAGIARDFPPPWSSTICSFHNRQIRAQSSRRHTRPAPAATTKPAIEVPQPQAEEVLA
jgi:hypothetical protein